MSPLYMVIDVESVGLHGEGFAVGWVVITGNGEEINSGLYHCNPSCALGYSDADREWIEKNIPDLGCHTHGTTNRVRNSFWTVWKGFHDEGAILVADCPWPVETKFLSQCIKDSLSHRALQSPYPLIDVASVRLAAGLDPIAQVDRRDNELPVHNPLCDARQSARLLLEALQKCQQFTSPVTP